MASTDYTNICNELHDQILQQLKRRDDESLQFVPRGTAKAILQGDFLLRLFDSLVPLGLPPHNASQQTDSSRVDFVDRVESKKLYNLLAILIYGKRPIEVARLFVRKLVAQDAWPVLPKDDDDDEGISRLDYLPAHRSHLLELFDNDEVTADKILDMQACFCPVLLVKGKEVRVQDPKHARLPYLKDEKLIGEGSYGKVFRVVVAAGHFYDPVSKNGNAGKQELARKDYDFSPKYKDRSRAERDIISKILNSNAWKCNNLLESYGSLEINDTYSLFMPLAICDLRQYMMEKYREAPSTMVKRAKMVLCAEGLADGLDFLHTKMQTLDQLEDLACYHMDLKPANVLVFKDTRHEDDDFIWKLSDFGMSRVKIKTRGRKEKEEDFRDWFKTRDQTLELTASPTVSHRGPGTYLAPESVSSNPTMNALSDVWALGCVISIVFAYLEEGCEGVESYKEARIRTPNAEGMDRFFLRGRYFSPYRVNPVVAERHEHVAKKAGQRNVEEGQIVRDLLTYLEKSTFMIRLGERDSAAQVKNMLLKTYRKYMAMANPPDGVDENRPSTSLWDRLFRRRKSVADVRVDVLSILTPVQDPYEYCEVSFDGDLAVFWSDTKLALFSSSPLTNDAIIKSPVSEYALEKESSTWKSISLSSDYLVASISGSDRFECYIFDLKGGDSEEDSFFERHLISLPLPEIKKLALSPDGETLACVLRHNENEPIKRYLFHAKVLDLIEMVEARSQSSVVSDRRGPGNSATPAREPWSIERLKRSAKEVTCFMFSAEDRVYMLPTPDTTPTPDITARSREIVSVSLSSKRVDTLSIESEGFDGSSTTIPFVTTFAPFHREPPTCAIVAREHTVIVANSDRRVEKTIENYRVLHLMMSHDDRTMFALGTRSAENKLHLLELSVPGPNDKLKVEHITEVSRLSHHDKFVARLAIHEDQRYVLIAAFARGNRASEVIIKIYLS